MQEKLSQITHYIENYEKNKTSNVLNYYEIFELIESSNISSIMESIKKKKLKILFHPDLLAYIPEEHKNSFEILSDAVKDMENIFSSLKSKEFYDEKLKQATIKKREETTEKFNQTKDFNNTNEDLDDFNDIIATNIKKHGFKFTSEAINMILNKESFRGITNTSNCRNRAINLGKKKIKAIISSFRNAKSINVNTDIINYYSFLIYQNSELKEKMDAYINACTKTALKYRFSQVEFAINQTLKTNFNDTNLNDFYPGFTNDGAAREKLNDLVNPKDLVFLSRIYLNIHRVNNYQSDDYLLYLSDTQIIREFVNLLEEQLTKEETNKHHR